jgi:homoserine kinase
VSKPKPITFHVPASAANLGPGYGVVGLALDLPLGITVEPRSDGEIVVERRDDPSAHLEDARHDPVLRGLRRGAELLGVSLAKGLSITVDGTIPRGTGMGTISAGYAAGLALAVRLAKKKCTVGELLDALVPLGGDPAHGAAALLGGLTATCQLSLPQESITRHRDHAVPRTEVGRAGGHVEGDRSGLGHFRLSAFRRRERQSSPNLMPWASGRPAPQFTVLVCRRM